LFLPIGDTPNPRNYTAWVTWALIAANVAVYLIVTLPMSGRPVDLNDPLLPDYLSHMSARLGHLSASQMTHLLAATSAYDLFSFTYGFKPGRPELTDLFISMFLHGGFLHLAGNMLFLWIFGDNVEQRLGRIGYLVTYLLTGAIATLTFAIFDWGSMVPLVGASGAISGVAGLYFLMFPRNKVKVLVVLIIFFDVLLLPARLVLGIYVLIDNLLPFILGGQTSVAYGAHLGGFAAGLAVAWGGRRFGWKLPFSDWRLRPAGRNDKSPDADERPLAGLSKAIEDGETRTALAWLPVLNGDDIERIDPAHCVVLAAWVKESGHPAAATRLLRRCLAAHSDSRDLSRVFLALGLLRLDQGQQAAAFQHLQGVFDHDPDQETMERAKEALARIDIYQRSKK